MITTNDKEKLYMKREVLKAKLARMVRRRLGFPTTAMIIKMIKASVIKKLAEKMKDIFISRVMKLMWIAKRTFPELLLPVSFLSTRIMDTREEDWSKLSRVLKDLNCPEALLGIKFGVSNNDYQVQIILETYIDVSYSVHKDVKSHTDGLPKDLLKLNHQNRKYVKNQVHNQSCLYYKDSSKEDF